MRWLMRRPRWLTNRAASSASAKPSRSAAQAANAVAGHMTEKYETREGRAKAPGADTAAIAKAMLRKLPGSAVHILRPDNDGVKVLRA